MNDEILKNKIINRLDGAGYDMSSSEMLSHESDNIKELLSKLIIKLKTKSVLNIEEIEELIKY